MNSTVLVTGGSGFLGCHTIIQLLEQGYRVRTTVRSPEKKAVVESMLRAAGVQPGERLSYFYADLLADDGWPQACEGCEYVLHVASPFFQAQTEAELIRPAVDGVIRVLAAARDAQVKRVVFTSTCGAIYYGHPDRTEPFDETDWTVVEADDVSPYVKSKTLAEQAAWAFMAREGGGLELSVVNPSGIFGPALGPDYSSSLDMIGRLINGSLPACPDLWFGVVDVRDVADLHLRVMTLPEAGGERYIATQGGAVSMLAIARVLRSRFAGSGLKIPRWKLPDIVVRVLARSNPQMQAMLPLLGRVRNASSAKAERVFGWKPRHWEAAVIATAESLVDLGLIGS